MILRSSATPSARRRRVAVRWPATAGEAGAASPGNASLAGRSRTRVSPAPSAAALRSPPRALRPGQEEAAGITGREQRSRNLADLQILRPVLVLVCRRPCHGSPNGPATGPFRSEKKLSGIEYALRIHGCLIARKACSLAGPARRASSSRFICPIPCSAEIEPPASVTRSWTRRLAALPLLCVSPCP
jgi:hypothetical protein